MFKKMVNTLLGKPEAATKPNASTKPVHNQNHAAKKDSAVKKDSATPKDNAPRDSAPKQKPRKKAQPKAPAWTIEQFSVPVAEGKTRFHDLGLPDSVMHAIADLGFQYCTPIQAESLPSAMAGKDVIGQAQTGTGKSAAFLLNIFKRLIDNPLGERFASEPRALVVAPTRELAMQIGKDAQGLGKYTGLNVVTVVGGMDYDKQRSQLRDEVVDILVATPGRLIDFMRSQDVYLDQVDVLVLDEADRMLDMGFIPDVRRIVKATPPKDERQTMLFSATFNYDVGILIDQWTIDPVRVEIEPEHVATDRVEQKFFLISGSDKYRILLDTLKQDTLERCIIFVNRRDVSRKLCDRLKNDGQKVALLTGEVNQNQRVKTLERFRSGQVNVMVATDVAGRGIHVDGVSHVVNYNLPEDSEDYVHRIGRTGRAGAEGVAISLIDEEDAFTLPELEKYLGKKLELTQP